MRETRRGDRRELSALEQFVKQAADAGAKLPGELHDAIKVEGVLDQRQTAARAELAAISPATLAERMAGELLDAAQKGSIPDSFGERVAEAERRQRTLEIEATVLERARERAVGAVMDIADDQDGIVTDCLRPVFGSVLDDVRRLAPALQGVPVDDGEVVLMLEPKRRDAAVKLHHLRRRFAALQEARRWLLAFTGQPEDDRDGTYALLRHPERAWSERWPLRHHMKDQLPWPTEPLAYLLWYAASDAEPWLPTSEEQDARAQEAMQGAYRPFGQAGAFTVLEGASKVAAGAR